MHSLTWDNDDNSPLAFVAPGEAIDLQVAIVTTLTTTVADSVDGALSVSIDVLDSVNETEDILQNNKVELTITLLQPTSSKHF